MRLAFLLHFLTLVVLSANAAPEASIKPRPVQTREELQSPKTDMETETTQISPAPAPRPFQYRWKASDGSTNFGLGASVGPWNKDKETVSVTTYNLQRTQYNLDETAQEFGLSLTSNGFFSLDWGFKKFCCFTSFAESWSPYYKYGLMGAFDPKDQLGNFIDYQRYFGQVSAGFENLFSAHRTWRAEVGARAGYLGTQGYLQIFYAWPD